ncbi:hypothetical protein [Nocardia fluminea]|uniref:Uncharacterized protein n=1 Tax=Nocardia fluminea TaxID=134984 RepID=A0A2N3V672_9NOCA|nr:hypothetical protein [Nocardia fluminea]PKV77117.1 hypothetical protein ATK86_1440 [Nocardia fluminea]
MAGRVEVFQKGVVGIEFGIADSIGAVIGDGIVALLVAAPADRETIPPERGPASP